MDIFTKKFGTLDLDLDPPTHSLGQSPKKIRFFFTPSLKCLVKARISVNRYDFAMAMLSNILKYH